MKPKKLESFIQSLSDDKDLGPYHGGSYTGPKGKTVTLTHVKLRALQAGINTEKVVLGKVVCTVIQPDQVQL